MRFTFSPFERSLFLIKSFGFVAMFASSFGPFNTITATPPELGEVRWMTQGENPIYLDLYPLFGRGASTEVFVQAELTSDSPISRDQIDIFLENPFLLPDSLEPNAFVEIIKGNGGMATVLGVLTVDNDINWNAYVPGETLMLKMRARDTSGAEAVYDLGEIYLYGPEPGDISADVSPPGNISDAEINNGEAIVVPENLSGSFFEFSGRVRGMDEGKGIRSIYLVYLSSLGDYLYFDTNTFGLVEGTLNNGLFAGVGTAGKYVESGDYHLFSFLVEDKAGNVFSLPAEEASASVQKVVQVVNPNADTEPPELVGPVLVSPLTADVTEDPAEATFNFTLKDEGTGVSNGTIRAFHSTDPDAGGPSEFFSSSGDLVSGDAFMGTYTTTLTFPTGQLPGDYWYELKATDEAGRSSFWGNVEPGTTLEPNPLPNGSDEAITVIHSATLDATPPVLESIAIVCDHDFSEGPGTVEITMMISEEESSLADGFSNTVRLVSPTGATDVTQSFGMSDQDTEPGAYKVQVPMAKALEPGPYCIAVELVNVDGAVSNYGLNYDDLPFPGEFSGFCNIVNSGAVDYTPPVPVEFSVTPNVAVLDTNLVVSVTMRVSDSGTGLQNGSISVKNGIANENSFRQTLEFIPFLPPDVENGAGEGTKFDGIYNFKFDLSESGISGDFLSFDIVLIDSAGNFRSYDTSLCNDTFAGTPLPYDIAQLGIVNLVDEEDYSAWADIPGIFPEDATSQDKDINNDFDGDGKTNGEEFVEKTDPADTRSRSCSWIIHESGIGSTIYFKPYHPDLIYTLSSTAMNGGFSFETDPVVPGLTDIPGVGKFFRPDSSTPTRNLFLITTVQPIVVFEGE